MTTLTVALPRLELVHPSYTADQPDLQTLLSVLYEPLLRWENGHVAPAALAGWNALDEGRRWELLLRDELRFTDGSACTAHDVRAAILTLRDADGPFGMGGVYAPYLREFEVAVTSPKRLTMTAEHPAVDYFDLFPAIYLSKPDPSGGIPLGTTSYRLEEYVPRHRMVVRWTGLDPRPEATSVIFIEVESADERLNLLEARGCDVATGLEESPKQRLADARISVKEVPTTLSVTMMLNGFAGFFVDPRARIALNHAIDVNELIDAVWPDRAIPARTVVSPYHYGFPTGLERLAFDPDKALRLFEQADVHGPMRFRSPLETPDRAPEIGRNIIDQLGRLGVVAELDLEPNRPKYARDVSEKRIADGAIFDSSPLSTFRVLVEKVRSDRPGLWWQGVRDVEADHLIEAAHTGLTGPQRLAAYQSCLRRLALVPPWLYLFHPIKVVGLRRPGLPASLNHAGVLVLES
jgi:peptide/nickel transport system substrate-binding protein